jgi:hypothetical protein
VRKGLEHKGGNKALVAGSQTFAHTSNSWSIRINSDWRVIEDALQWILQRRKGRPRSKASGWRSRSFLRTRDGLLACVREHCGEVDPHALASLMLLPERHGTGQVLTEPDSVSPVIAATDQEASAVDRDPKHFLASLVVVQVVQPSIHASIHAEQTKHTSSHASHGRESAFKQPDSRASAKSSPGGWPSARRLEWSDVKGISHAVHGLTRCGYAPTHLVSIMPLVGDPSSRKRACTRTIGHFGQALKRHGKGHVGLTVFENSDYADLHAHHLVHAPRGQYATIEARHRPPEIHVERIRNLDGIVDYLTKQRRHLSPDVEAVIKRRWETCQAVPGKRWTMTTEARDLLLGRKRCRAGSLVAQPRSRLGREP